MRAGNRAVVTKILKKLDDAIEEPTIVSYNDRTLLNTVDQKISSLKGLDEQVLHKTEMEGIDDHRDR